MLGLLPPDKGSVKFKGLILSENLNRILFHSLVAHVPQTPLILNTTIRDNIFYGAKFIDNERLIQCTKDTMLFNFVKKESLDFICGENGKNLSGGQRQRIAIARALYSDKEILFLDECTSALDLKTEEFILKNIFKSYKDKTIISITHKQNTLYLYNKIIHINEDKSIQIH